MSLNELHRRWVDLTSFVEENKREKWWSLINERYSTREFHGFLHLSQMMKLFDEHKEELKDRYAVAFAIFFKNLAFDPAKGLDAEENVNLMKQFASEATLNQENYIISLLEDSANNCTEAHLSKDSYGEMDVHFLIDFDTAWMADSPDEYRKHCEAVRRESANLSDDEYRTERLKLLRLFLQVPNIFATKTFRDRYESAARKNIEKEIKRLSMTS
ncbi:hypothetical protein M3Y98_01197000 [Aphelenchoides besseyi]|nr:hypothetical protein M3Y98_01197000 [Aphelenchoides besseyi]KAI6193154.1 hypothetical protein M3Y96_00988200 [Aphelenchoides besseyi]